MLFWICFIICKIYEGYLSASACKNLSAFEVRKRFSTLWMAPRLILKKAAVPCTLRNLIPSLNIFWYRSSEAPTSSSFFGAFQDGGRLSTYFAQRSARKDKSAKKSVEKSGRRKAADQPNSKTRQKVSATTSCSSPLSWIISCESLWVSRSFSADIWNPTEALGAKTSSPLEVELHVVRWWRSDTE